MNSTSASSKEGRFRFDIEKYTSAPTQSYRPFRKSLLSFYATFAHRDEPVKAGVWNRAPRRERLLPVSSTGKWA